MMFSTSPRGLRRRCRGVLSMEYMLILALVVLPLGLLLPMFVKMIVQYATRMVVLIRLPF
jgi:hypothetical protein